MQEHVGKKRRKEFRTAINMKSQLQNGMIFMLTCLVIGIVCSLGLTISLGRLDPMAENSLAQILLTIVIFVFIIFLGNRSYKWSGLKKEYDEHCKRYNITKQDMKDLKEGRL